MSEIVKPMPREVDVVPLALDIDDNELRAYINIARQIDFLPVELLENRLLSFFRERNICIFDVWDEPGFKG